MGVGRGEAGPMVRLSLCVGKEGWIYGEMIYGCWEEGGRIDGEIISVCWEGGVNLW